MLAIRGIGGPAADGYADAAIDLSARRQQPLQHWRMHAETGAPTLKPPPAPLGDRHLPARTQEGVARKQAAKGTADDDRAPHGRFLVMEGETFESDHAVA